MYCPNCGLANEAGAKFCANCGTTLREGGPAPSTPTPISQVPVNSVPVNSSTVNPVPSALGGGSMARNIGIGCLVAVALVMFVGLSCTRACFGGHRRSHVIRYR